MRLCTLTLDEAVGHILCHNLADAGGRKAFAKGHRLKADDLPRLRELGLTAVRVAVLEPGDVHEDAAAQRLAVAVAGAGCAPTAAHTGRVNLRATCDGPLAVAEAELLAINSLDGLTVATLHAHTLVRSGQIVATIKVIPYAVPAERLEQAEALGRASRGLLQVAPLHLRRVGIVLVSSPAARQRVQQGVLPAITGRVTDLGAEVAAVCTVDADEAAVAAAIADLRAQGAELIIIAGETSIMDSDDVTPSGIRQAGGRIEHYGAPVEPGNLLLLAYLEAAGAAPIPVLGAPGCVRSRNANIVDLLLPRLMAGEMVRKMDIIALGHGGLLE